MPGIASAAATYRAPVQINLAGLFPRTNFPFIDCSKSADRIWNASGATEDHFALIQADGYPSRMASGAATYSNFIGIYLTDSDPWVVTWTGAGTVTLTTSDSNVSSSV